MFPWNCNDICLKFDFFEEASSYSQNPKITAETFIGMMKNTIKTILKVWIKVIITKIPALHKKGQWLKKNMYNLTHK